MIILSLLVLGDVRPCHPLVNVVVGENVVLVLVVVGGGGVGVVVAVGALDSILNLRLSLTTTVVNGSFPPPNLLSPHLTPPAAEEKGVNIRRTTSTTHLSRRHILEDRRRGARVRRVHDPSRAVLGEEVKAKRERNIHIVVEEAYEYYLAYQI